MNTGSLESSTLSLVAIGSPFVGTVTVFAPMILDRWLPSRAGLRPAAPRRLVHHTSKRYLAFSGRVQPLVDPVDPEKVNVPVEVGLQFLGKRSRKAPWGVSQLRAESFSISMRFHPHALQA